MAERRHSFGPVVLLGLAAGTLAAVAGARPWAEGSSGRVDTSDEAAVAQLGTAQEMPLAIALALVVLACWGALLVTRGRFRRAVAALAALAAAGLVVTCVVGFGSVQDGLAGALRQASGTDTASVSLTGWYVAACVGALLSLGATVAAVLLVPGWPEMGQRYDAPSGRATSAGPAGNLDLWKALDEGHDPTDPTGSDDRPAAS